jgi:hypothetical protein
MFAGIFVKIRIHSLRGCYARFGAYPNYIHIKIYKRNNLNESNKATARIEIGVRALIFNAGPLAGGQFASGGSCDRPT